MKLDTLIAELQALREADGNLEVCVRTQCPECGKVDTFEPKFVTVYVGDGWTEPCLMACIDTKMLYGVFYI